MDGELKVSRKLQLLQTSTDADFSVSTKWSDLGGSLQAAEYLESLDVSKLSMMQMDASAASSCSEEAKRQASETCFEHLGALVCLGAFHNCFPRNLVINVFGCFRGSARFCSFRKADGQRVRLL